jgi:hypothetical protein
MSDEQEPKPAKFKGRLGNSFSQFGNQDLVSATSTSVETQSAETAKALNVKSAKVQEDRVKTVGRTIRFPPDLHRYLKAYAGLHERDVSDLVVEEMEKFRASHPLTL